MLAAVGVVLSCQFVGGLLGMSMFMGVLRNRCYSTNRGQILSQQICMCKDCTMLSSKPMGRPYECPPLYECLPLGANPGMGSESFDNIGSCMSTMMQVLTMSGWSKVIYTYIRIRIYIYIIYIYVYIYMYIYVV